MSIPSAPPKPEVSTAAGGLPAATSMSLVAQTDRTVDADFLVDVPQLSVEELTLELEASVGLSRVKLDAKGLQAGLYLKADFENLQALAQKRSGSHGPVRSGLRELLSGTRDVIEHVTPSDHAEDQAQDDHDHDQSGNRAGAQETRQRVRHAVGQGAKAAGLTAAGLAGGALLEARVKPSSKLPRQLPKLPKLPQLPQLSQLSQLPRNLPLPRRRSRAQILRDEFLKRLPSPS
jgi:hypothetical protein